MSERMDLTLLYNITLRKWFINRCFEINNNQGMGLYIFLIMTQGERIRLIISKSEEAPTKYLVLRLRRRRF